MINVTGIIELAIGAIFINNIVLSRFLGICPLIGATNRVSSAAGMGLAVTFVMALASVITGIFYRFLLVPFGIGYLQTIVFILIIAALVQLVEVALQKISPLLYESLGIYIPLIATNCAVFAVALAGAGISGDAGQSVPLLFNFINGILSGIGFTVALVIMAGIQEKTSGAPVPGALQGLPIALLRAGLIALAFLGFSGMTFTAGAGG
jgi:electron transport complex protein RnfA